MLTGQLNIIGGHEQKQTWFKIWKTNGFSHKTDTYIMKNIPITVQCFSVS